MYTFEITLAICVCVFLWNITLLMKIRFGDQLITHLSVWPYVLSLALVTLMIFENLYLCYVSNILLKDRDFKAMVWTYFYPLKPTGTIESFINLLKVALTQSFILLRVHEHLALLMFCIFQKKLRVQDLDIHKDSFQ